MNIAKSTTFISVSTTCPLYLNIFWLADWLFIVYVCEIACLDAWIAIDSAICAVTYVSRAHYMVLIPIIYVLMIQMYDFFSSAKQTDHHHNDDDD